MRPGGNDTALLSGVLRDPGVRKIINDAFMELYPNVEQVGFVNLDPAAVELVMAGGEFCGNATRSTAWLALGGKPGEIEIRVSGVKNKLRAGVMQNGDSFAQMPIYSDTSKITTDFDTPDNKIVEMEGITQYINFNSEEIAGLSADDIKQRAMTLIQTKCLDRFPAAGVMYTQRDGNQWRITPVVYVRDIDTLFLETACGSGTTALGMVLALRKQSSVVDVPIIQPSGKPIAVTVTFDGQTFLYAQISGPVDTLAEGKFIEAKKTRYAIEKITDPKALELALENNGLIKLYEIFRAAPYFESFTDAEVKDFFEGYMRDGILLLARNADKIIGFNAAVPLATVPDIAEIIGISEDQKGGIWYIADLGDDEEFRNMGIGEQLTTATNDQIRCNGGTRVYLRTSENNFKALSLYKKLGFQTILNAMQEVRQKRSIPGVPEIDRRIFLSKTL